MNYTEIKRIADAKELASLHTDKWSDISDAGVKIGGYGGHTATWREDGLVLLHTSTLATTESYNHISIWPDNIQWMATLSPRKEYILVKGQDGVTRNYLMPKHTWNGTERSGLLIYPHPTKNYVPIEPIQDYRITISRKQKADAMKKWQPLFDYMETMWDLIPTDVIPEHVTVDDVNLTDKEPWYRLIQTYKRANKWAGKERVREWIEAKVLAEDLPYKVELVTTAHTSHTAHWSWELLDKLRAAGKLDNLPVWQPKS